MKWMPLLLAVFLLSCKKDDAVEEKDFISATVNGTPTTTNAISIEKDPATGELLRFTGTYGTNSSLGVEMGPSAAFTPGEYVLRSSGIETATLTSFSGAVQNNRIRLAWTTGMEQGLQKFEVERSADGQNFTTIGSVNAAGNSSAPIAYEFFENSIGMRTYFRLRMVDTGGTWAYSQVVLVMNANYYTAFIGEGTSRYYGKNGSLKIESHDRVKHIVAGSFSFDAGTPGGVKQVRNGAFRIKY